MVLEVLEVALKVSYISWNSGKVSYDLSNKQIMEFKITLLTKIHRLWNWQIALRETRDLI